MRNFLILPFLFFAFLSMTACSPNQEEPFVPETSEHSENDRIHDNDNENMETNIAGVYVVGDIRVKQVRQVSTAVADGTVAGIHLAK